MYSPVTASEHSLKCKRRLLKVHPLLACVAGVNGEGEGERERGRKMGFWELGMRERLLQRPPFFHFRPPIFSGRR